jgi:2-keto-4-pentenoate hydratase/2-oxohepta-3-ene-1,7-dioic acid hydratase in catechol pathway
MKSNRRNFITSSVAVGAAGVAALASVTPASAATGTAAPDKSRVQPLPTGMAFATLRTANGLSLGIRDGDRVLDVAAAETHLRLGAPTTIDDVLHGRGEVSALARLLAKAQAASAGKRWFVSLADAQFGPCVTHPEKIVCVGLNYRAHIAEANEKLPPVPILFNKFNSALNHHGGEIAVSKERVAKWFDYEAELVIVMGKTARDVSEQDALSYVFGYCTGNDFSARDLQFESSQWMAGKAGDGWAPMGPWLVTAEQVDPDNLDIECLVNGDTRQSSNTSRMIFGCRKLVSFISQRMTLRPGDIIFTGTPEGVIIGYPKDKQVWLKAGDKVVTRIGKLGELEFKLS